MGWPHTDYDLGRTRYVPGGSQYRLTDAAFAVWWTAPPNAECVLVGNIDPADGLETVTIFADSIRVYGAEGGALAAFRPASALNIPVLQLLQDVDGDEYQEIFVGDRVSRALFF